MIIAIFVLPLFLQCVGSQENTAERCTAEFDGLCLRRVNCTVEEKVVLEKSELFVAYIGQEQEEEVIAQCDWQSGSFLCDPVEGYTCDLLLPRYFTVSINKAAHCLSSGEFQVDAAHQQTIRCDISKYRKNISDLNSQITSTTSKDTIDEIKDNGVVAVAVGSVIGGLVILIVIGVVILAWIKMCRKSRAGSAEIIVTHEPEEKTVQEKTTFLTELEKNHHRKRTCAKRLRHLLFPEAPASDSVTV